MRVHSVTVGLFEANCYVLADDAGSALVVDPGDDPERIAELIRTHRLTVAAFLVTHGHMDHVAALAPLAEQFPAPIAMHPRDAAWAFRPGNRMQPFYQAPRPPRGIDRPLADGQTWQDGALRYEILETPGHSPGCVCFHFPAEACVLTGDTLFAGSVGRTDLPGGSDRALRQSLRKLLRLPDETRVWPGHGPPTSIGAEKRDNPFLWDGEH
jgi:glyoxylase-like metal-dependent hydrolase (beta-lactamase superfamily II)